MLSSLLRVSNRFSSLLRVSNRFSSLLRVGSYKTSSVCFIGWTYVCKVYKTQLIRTSILVYRNMKHR